MAVAVGADVGDADGEGLGSVLGRDVGSGWAQAIIARGNRLRRPITKNHLMGAPYLSNPAAHWP